MQDGGSFLYEPYKIVYRSRLLLLLLLPSSPIFMTLSPVRLTDGRPPGLVLDDDERYDFRASGVCFFLRQSSIEASQGSH